jgi:hypothetical protein
VIAAAPWWIIHGDVLLGALRRAHDGENPDLLYTELYANADHELPPEEGAVEPG